MLALSLLLALAALGYVLRERLQRAILVLATFGPGAPISPSMNYRGKTISTVTTISATTTDCDETAGYYEIPRGAENISFEFLSTLNTGFSTGATFFKGSIVGANSPSDTFVPIPSLETAELVVDVAQVLPSASAAPGVSLPRFIKVKWTETGSMTSFTATCRIRYTLPGGAGRQYDAAYVGG